MTTRSESQTKLRALGRLRTGKLNKCEQKYRARLQALKEIGEVAEFWFESVKFKVADGACWYMPDFLVLYPDGRCELHEVKGAKAIFADDAKVKTKVVATRYPFPVKVAYPDTKEPGGWRFEEF